MLTGLTVLVTRPAAQAKLLCDAIIEQGGNVILFPTLEIQPLADRTLLLTTLQHLAEYKVAIFVSANAAKYALKEWPNPSPTHLKIAALGPATAKIVQLHGVAVDILSPAPFSSAALLMLPEFTQVQGQRIVIFCGENSKTLLADTLQQRGAIVTSISVYRRLCPVAPTATQCQAWQRQGVSAIISTSSESLQNLHELFSREYAGLKQTPLIVISQRMAQLAIQLGFMPYVAANASDGALLEALKIWYDIPLSFQF
jgi:uroporphyrinogen-III synthase